MIEEIVKKWCSKCHRSFPATTEYFYRDHPGTRSDGKLRAQCKKCCDNADRKRDRSAGKTAVDERCDACGSRRVNLRGDTNIVTGKRYGYLCTKCYQLVTLSKGDANRLVQVACYLKSRTTQDNPTR